MRPMPADGFAGKNTVGADDSDKFSGYSPQRNTAQNLLLTAEEIQIANANGYTAAGCRLLLRLLQKR